MRTFVLLSVLLASACATPRVDDPPLSVSIAVSGLRPDEREYLTREVCAMEGVRECSLVAPDPPPPAPSTTGKKKRAAPPPATTPPSDARIVFQYRGSLGVLRYRIASLPHPGLEPLSAQVSLSYRGFDNLAPSIEILEPRDGFETNQRQIDVLARVPDIDTRTVEIGEEEARKDGDRFSGRVDLKEGENLVTVRAVDHAGNAREAGVRVVLDTEPPALEVQIDVLAYDKALVKGRVKDAVRVTIDGRDVQWDLFGAFQKEVSVDPDKSYTEIVATDELGNARKIRRSVKIASPMSADTK